MSEHDRIWLEPKGAPDRCWCQDNQWGDEGVEYVRASLSASIPAEIGELVERLSHTAGNPAICKEAASLIQSQAARIAELEAGLEPFADRYDAWGDTAEVVYTYEDYTPRMVSDFARARALLNRRAEG